MPGRRTGFTEPLTFREGEAGEITTFITCNFDAYGRIREVFCADPRVGSDIHALLTDGCILISIYLQTGGEPELLPGSLGENRAEGEKSGPPSSILGAVARAILRLQQHYNEQVGENV
jgi:hypothetical protein